MLTLAFHFGFFVFSHLFEAIHFGVHFFVGFLEDFVILAGLLDVFSDFVD